MSWMRRRMRELKFVFRDHLLSKMQFSVEHHTGRPLQRDGLARQLHFDPVGEFRLRIRITIVGTQVLSLQQRKVQLWLEQQWNVEYLELEQSTPVSH